VTSNLAKQVHEHKSEVATGFTKKYGCNQLVYYEMHENMDRAINREKQTPIQMALRVFPALLYGSDHAYGNPFTGSGTIESLNKMTINDLKKFHQTWFKPNNATIVVVGDITMDEIKSRLEDVFDDWQPGEVPQKNIAEVSQPAKPVVYLMNRPGAQQSVILASFLAPPKANPNEIAIDAMNDILGGTFTSRLNMNLREDKHWSYGARSIIVSARGQRPYIAYAPVQWDKTTESMQGIGVLDDRGQLMCGVVYNDYRPEYGTMQLSIASSNPMWARKETIIQLLAYPFIDLKIYKCWITIASDNLKSLALTKHIGFKQEAILRHQYGKDRHAHFMKMSLKDFKRIYGR